MHNADSIQIVRSSPASVERGIESRRQVIIVGRSVEGHEAASRQGSISVCSTAMMIADGVAGSVSRGELMIGK